MLSARFAATAAAVPAIAVADSRESD